MPNLEQSLQGKDLGLYKIVAKLWGLDFSVPDARVGLSLLISLMLEKERVKEMYKSLTPTARQAVNDLAENGGILPATLFLRRYGEIREIGIARRDRERPYLNPQASVSEILWYRAIISKTTLDQPDGLEEFICIPEDLLALIPFEQTDERKSPLGRFASQSERAFVIPANSTILDDACTLLAGLRNGFSYEAIQSFLGSADIANPKLSARELAGILEAAGLIEKNGDLNSEAVREFLEMKRGDALKLLYSGWVTSPAFNEIRLVPGLISQGTWDNDPLIARKRILGFLSTVENGPRIPNLEADRPFWSLESFISAVHEIFPDYQRPAGDYDSWYLIDSKSGAFLRGFESWDQIDGALIRFIISGPLHWLGILDLAYPSDPDGTDIDATAFRFSSWAFDLRNNRAPENLQRDESEPVIVRSDGIITASRKTSRTARYLIARFSEWEEIRNGIYRYRLTPRSLRRADQQGLKIQHIINILQKYSASIPPKLDQALRNWETQGSTARIQQAVILRLKDPGVMTKIRNSKAGRFLGEPLSPTSIIIREGAWRKVLDAMTELGILTDAQIEGDEALLNNKSPE